MAQFPTTAGASDLALLLGLTPRRLQQLAAQGVLTRDGHGKYSLAQNVQAFLRWKIESEKERRGPAADAASEREDIRTRREALKLAKEENHLIETEEALAVLDEIIGTLKSDAAGLPARITRDIGLRRKIETEIDGCFNRASKRFAERASALRESGEAGIDQSEDDA